MAASLERRKQFEARVLPHLDAAYRFARWLTRSPTDADDVVQEAVLRAFRGADSLRGDGDAKAWLLTIVRNCYLTAALGERRRAHVPLPEEHDVQDGFSMIADTPEPERESQKWEQQRLVERLLAALSVEHREILVLREFEELDYRAIAEVMALPIGTVMSRLARARAAFKAQWLAQQREGAHVIP